MTLVGLTSIHQIEVYGITETEDDSMTKRETVGALVARFRCRVRPMSMKERRDYDAVDVTEMMKIFFHEDPEITNLQLVKYRDKMYRRVDLVNPHYMDRYWRLVVRRLNQTEIDAIAGVM